MTLEQFASSNTPKMRQFSSQYKDKNKEQSLFEWVDEFEAWSNK